MADANSRLENILVAAVVAIIVLAAVFIGASAIYGVVYWFGAFQTP